MRFKQPFVAGVLAIVMLLPACAGTEQRKASYLEKGNEYFRQQNYDKARVEVRNALQIDPKYVEALYLAGRVAEKRGELREAAGAYQTAVDENPKYMPARASLARLYLLGGLPDKAASLVKEGLVTDPDNAALLTVQAGGRARDGDLEGALADAEKAYRIAPGDEFTVALLASLYKQNQQIDKAVAVVAAGAKLNPRSVDLRIVRAELESSRRNYQAVETQLKEIIAIEPAVLLHRNRLAQFYVFRKDDAAAEAVWRDAIKELPEQAEPKLALIEFLWSRRGEATGNREIEAQLQGNPKDARLKLQIGTYLEARNQGERARKLFEEVIRDSRLDAEGLDARNRLGAYYLRHGQYDKVAPLVAEVLKENARDNDALILRAELAMQKGDAPSAITDLRGVLRDQPNSAPLLRALARAHLRNNEPSLAEESLKASLQANPGELSTGKELAQLQLLQGKPDQALLLLAEMEKLKGESDAEMIDLTIKAQLMNKAHDAAARTAANVQQAQPAAAIGWYYEGLVAEAQQDHAAARRAYETALDKEPGATEPLSALVRIDIADRNTTNAIERAERAIAANPSDRVAWNLKGELLIAKGDMPEAEKSFARAIEAAPGWWPPYRGLAFAQSRNKQVDAAVATLRDGVAKTRSGALATELAVAYERQSKPEESIKVYEEWLEREPQSIVAANNLAMLLLTYRSDAASLKRTEKLADILVASNEPAVLDTRGWIKYKTDAFQEAVNLLQRAANAQPASALIRYHLGMAQWKSGNTASARENLQLAVKNEQSFPGLADAKKALAQLETRG